MQINTRIIPTATLSVVTVSLLIAACQGKAMDLSEVEEQLASIAEKQDTIVSKLDELEKGPAAPAKPQQPNRPDPSAVYKVALGDAATKGPADAKITIVEWSDFQCPYCKRVGPTLEQLEKEYRGDVRVAFKHNPLPFHKDALPAALAAEAAGKQGKFWEMHDILFENGKALTQDNFDKWAKELKLDITRFNNDMKDPALKKKVTGQQQQGAKLGARGTPAFFINGRFLSGAQPVANFKKVIDEELKRADAELEKGTTKDKLYDALVANGKTSV